MEQAPYRAFFLDEKNHIRSARVLEATDDEGAKAEAAKYVDGLDIEIWQGTRVVARLPSVQPEPHRREDV